MVTVWADGETVNRAAIGGLVEMVARCAVGKTKLNVEVDLCRIRRDGHDSLRIAEIAKDLRLTSNFSLALGAEKDGCFDFSPFSSTIGWWV